MHRHSSVLVPVLVLVLAHAVSGCPSSSSPPEPAVSWRGQVQPLLAERCMGCHKDGGIAPFSLERYDDARLLSGDILAAVVDQRMPPWGAFDTDECAPPLPWKDDLRLLPDEVALLQRWHDDGAPEGTTGTAAPVHEPPTIDAPDLDLQPDAPFVTAGATDQFRCFVLNPFLVGGGFLRGVAFVPGNPKVVHHILLFSDPNHEGRAQADADGGYDCFGGPGVSDATLLAAWAPGGLPDLYPDDVGVPVDPGAHLVMQIHYHPAGTTADPDSTRVLLQMHAGVPANTLLPVLIGNAPDQASGLLAGDDDDGAPRFFIPKGKRGHVERMEFTIPAGTLPPGARIFAAGTHMHMVGTDMRLSIRKAGGDDVCLVQTPRWDFNWQRSYAYDAPLDALPPVVDGDTVVLRCTYDNSESNLPLLRARTAAGLDIDDVVLGETTFDEMCLGAVGLLFPTPDNLQP